MRVGWRSATATDCGGGDEEDGEGDVQVRRRDRGDEREKARDWEVNFIGERAQASPESDDLFRRPARERCNWPVDRALDSHIGLPRSAISTRFLPPPQSCASPEYFLRRSGSESRSFADRPFWASATAGDSPPDKPRTRVCTREPCTSSL